jgi:hypothetical protein
LGFKKSSNTSSNGTQTQQPEKMKTLLCIFAAAALLCGCSKPAADPRIAQLETRITALESNISALQSQNEKQNALATNLFCLHTRLLALVQSNLVVMQDQEFELGLHETVIKSLSGLVTNLMDRLAVKNPQPYTRTAQPLQIPADVVNGIRADAEREWPTNYDMQIYEIQKQIEAWHKLHP